MKSSTNYLAAGSLAVATLLALKGLDLITHAHQFSPPNPPVMTVNKRAVEILPQALVQHTVNSPVTRSGYSQPDSRVVKGKYFRTQPGNTYHLKYAVVNFIKPADAGKKINVPGLALKIHLRTFGSFSDDLPPEQTAAIPGRLQEQAATGMPSLAIQQQRTGGSAYHAAGAASKSGMHTSSATAMPVFSAIRQPDKGADAYSYATVYNATELLKDFAVRNGNNTDYAILINLGVKSSKKRCFLMNLSTNTIVRCGIVAEGSADANASSQKKYSNEMGSSASSLGIFKISKRMNERSYSLQGLQESNSNASKRGLLLQTTDDVPNEEIDLPALTTNGSLSLSASFFKQISPLLDAGSKPVLLWVYDPAAQSQPLYQSVQNQ